MISLLVIACDEEIRLRGCVESARGVVDEVVIVVQVSTDGTLALARELGDTVIGHPRHGYCEASRPSGVAACRGEWILNLDADERLTDHGRALVPTLVAAGTADGYRLRRLTTAGDLVLEDATHGRLFRRASVACATRLHSTFVTPRMIDAPGPVVIAHAKTWDEQRADDARYARLGGA